MPGHSFSSQIHLVTGGSRSGKSAHALGLARGENEVPPDEARRVFIATCPVIDGEMRERVQRHQQERAGLGWKTIEEELRLMEMVSRTRSEHPRATILIDSLSLWINNLMFHAGEADRLTEETVAHEAAELVALCRTHPGRTIFVTDEVGSGIIPESKTARRFRDLLGRCNQTVAGLADAVTLLCCGIPMPIKRPAGAPERI